MTSNYHALMTLATHRATMDGTTSSELAKVSESLKAILSSDCSLQLDYMKPESLVNRGSARRGEYVPGSCTHRPSHHEFVTPEAGGLTLYRREPSKVG